MAQTYSFKVAKNIVKSPQDKRIATPARRKTSPLATTLGLALIGFAVAALLAMAKVMWP
jgi:hypothetical protein